MSPQEITAQRAAARQNQFYAEVIENQCQTCQRRSGTSLTCEAFPDGIPPMIFMGGYDHTHPYDFEGKDDGGLTYLPLSEREVADSDTERNDMNTSQEKSAFPVSNKWTSPVQEQHIDFLLEEEFASDPGFLAFFLDAASEHRGESWKAGLPAASSAPNCSSIRSVTTDQGETDVLVIYESLEAERVAILIEDKIRAGFQPQQAERYRMRGEDGKKSHKRWDRFWTCLVAPERYAETNEGFDTRVSLETLRKFFSGDDSRSKFKAGVLERALHQFTQTGLQKKDEVVTKFRSFYAEEAEAFFTIPGEIAWPKARDAWWGDTWFNFRAGRLPKGVEIVHKAPTGTVDLTLPNTPQETLGRVLAQCALERDVVAVQTGKSASLRLTIEKLTDYEHREDAKPIVLEAFECVRWLAAFYAKHEALLKPLL